MKLKKILLSMLCINFSLSLLGAYDKEEKEFNEFSNFLENGLKKLNDKGKTVFSNKHVLEALDTIRFLTFNSFSKDLKKNPKSIKCDKNKVLCAFDLVANVTYPVLEDLNNEFIKKDAKDFFDYNKNIEQKEERLIFSSSTSDKFAKDKEIVKNLNFFIKISNNFISWFKYLNIIPEDATYGVINVSKILANDQSDKPINPESSIEMLISFIVEDFEIGKGMQLITFFKHENNFLIGRAESNCNSISINRLKSYDGFLSYVLKEEELILKPGLVFSKFLSANSLTTFGKCNDSKQIQKFSYSVEYFSGANAGNPFFATTLFLNVFGGNDEIKKLFKDIKEDEEGELFFEIPETKEDWLSLDYVMLSQIENENKNINLEFIEDDIKSIENNNILSIEYSDLKNSNNEVSNLNTMSISDIVKNIEEDIIKEKEENLTVKINEMSEKINEISEKINDVKESKKGKKGKKNTFNRRQRGTNDEKTSKENKENLILLKKEKESLEKEKNELRSNFKEFISKKTIKFKDITSFVCKIFKKLKNGITIVVSGSHISVHKEGSKNVATVVKKHGKDKVYKPGELKTFASNIIKMALEKKQ